MTVISFLYKKPIMAINFSLPHSRNYPPANNIFLRSYHNVEKNNIIYDNNNIIDPKINDLDEIFFRDIPVKYATNYKNKPILVSFEI